MPPKTSTSIVKAHNGFHIVRKKNRASNFNFNSLLLEKITCPPVRHIALLVSFGYIIYFYILNYKTSLNILFWLYQTI